MQNPSEHSYVDHLRSNGASISVSLVEDLLHDFNWRTRSVGAIYAAYKDYTEFIETIGNHMLKSEVCFAGKSYATALGYFGGADSKRYLCQYLDYYLTRKDLYFDQAEALSALRYIDVDAADSYQKAWNSFAADKNWNLQRTYDWLSADIESLQN
jgi:hypothetical protein